MEEKLTMADFEDEINASMKKFKKGDMVKGLIANIEDYVVHVDIGTYMQGIILPTELSDDPSFNMMDDLKIGDEITCIVVGEEDANGNLILSLKQAANILAWESLAEGKENETVYTVKISKSVNGGWIAYLNGIRGFIPVSRLSLKRIEDSEKESYVGKTYDVIIADMDEGKNSLILSARELEQKRADKEHEEKVLAVKPGTVMKGIVESIMPYGCFVDIGGGLSGLVHISQISHRRLKSPSEEVKIGQEVDVKVIEIKDGKISLSMKALLDFTEKNDTDKDDGPSEYLAGEEATTGMASLLAGLKLD